MPKDAAETEILSRYQKASAPIANRLVGSVTADITRSAGANGESALGDVIADAQLKATAPTDFGGSVIAFMNPGGIRNDLLFANSAGGEAPGQVTYGELFNVQPFGNSLVVKTCTGAQIDALLEQQIFPTTRILQVSAGFTYTFDAAAAAGQRIDPSTIKLNGVTLNPNTGYRVTMNSFLATGGDGFTVFNQCTNALGGEIDLDALARYFTQFGDRCRPDRRTASHGSTSHTSTVSPSRGITTPGTAAARSARARWQWLIASMCTRRRRGRVRRPHGRRRSPSRSARPRGTTRRPR